MNKLSANPLLAMGVALGTSLIAAVPAMAGYVPLTNPTFTSTGVDYTLWCPGPVGTIKPCVDQSATTANLSAVLQGGPGNPGGNVELGKPTNPNFNGGWTTNTTPTTLSGDIGGKTFTASSLTYSDWSANGNALTYQFIGDAIKANGITLPAGKTLTDVVNNFITLGGPQRFSNPNIGYVFAEGSVLNVGLQGILNARILVQDLFPGVTLPPVIQASELVKVNWDGQTNYLYSFVAGNSGQSVPYQYGGLPICVGGAPSGTSDPIAACSQTGDYDIRVAPEPSSLLGLLVIGGGMLATKRRKYS